MPKQAIPLLIIIILAIFALSCESAPVVLSPVPGTAILDQSRTPTSPGFLPIAQTGSTSVDEIANDITRGVGKVIQVLPGDPNRVIFLLEESHAFTLGQVESALILNRLYATYGVRTFALERLAAGQSLDLAWAHRPSPFTQDKPITNREDVILQTLAEGDANNMEALGLIYNDVTIAGIDDAVLYAIALAEMTDTKTKDLWIQFTSP